MGGHLGIDYLTFMSYMAKALHPSSYFEIGTNTGSSLKLFSCDAACVDPNFQINDDILMHRKKTFFFQMTSDEFFAGDRSFNFFPKGR